MAMEATISYGRGHSRGTKKQSAKVSSWYDKIQAEHLRRIEAEFAAKAAQASQKK